MRSHRSHGLVNTRESIPAAPSREATGHSPNFWKCDEVTVPTRRATKPIGTDHWEVRAQVQRQVSGPPMSSVLRWKWSSSGNLGSNTDEHIPEAKNRSRGFYNDKPHFVLLCDPAENSKSSSPENGGLSAGMWVQVTIHRVEILVGKWANRKTKSKILIK